MKSRKKNTKRKAATNTILHEIHLHSLGFLFVLSTNFTFFFLGSSLSLKRTGSFLPSVHSVSHTDASSGHPNHLYPPPATSNTRQSSHLWSPARQAEGTTTAPATTLIFRPHSRPPQAIIFNATTTKRTTSTPSTQRYQPFLRFHVVENFTIYCASSSSCTRLLFNEQ